MLVFPQLSTGASTQYPTDKTVSQRSVQSSMEDGTIISLADSSATHLRWKMLLRDLSDQEASSFTDFFASTLGNLQPFLFLDPTANLLVWSQDFTQAAWTTCGVTFDLAIADPLGGKAAQQANNSTSETLSVAQQSQIPGTVQTCFSVYMRADIPVTISLTISAGSQSQSLSVAVTGAWQRYYVAALFPGSTALLQYTIQLPVGSQVQLFGPQVDAQVTPSLYLATTGSSGVYMNARFDATHIERIATGLNRNTCVLFVRCNLPGGA